MYAFRTIFHQSVSEHGNATSTAVTLTKSHAEDQVICGCLCRGDDGLESPNTKRVSKRVYFVQCADARIEGMNGEVDPTKLESHIQFNITRERVYLANATDILELCPRNPSIKRVCDSPAKYNQRGKDQE